ncbi:50S ribosomal protein L11 methyltransferase [Ketogulonicigenium vulgare]|uniref:Ribosomal protein L11 methyltransferase n=1 Tax=Ketogulonicigenium vulgare (strain WSH-001) TaxID=759362 RepID=F9Y9I8_KETVW|nr:50S ribosomal protein L11 methyltransferase [Ketogulonicigenium vulgare]ADO41947.1 ribosomal protein L11 methyltransferase [Ketogulonicigenium vulgare Y25]AEM40170.1 Ribosomal protein L11 methyltransferase, putative [Ketogulonicigenium vulgare WSH-001]ALJ80376.1 ribosomal protein L11 methyltransferase [Ketogulonicigenium vulgare]ANW33210.1 ribosomal protein L11 methyltransferase [Ketogulonicigenium vulgare]AOZ53872.1 ribosomal protein L11 methyltransferase [Ketogulonicigenium vulgare]
MTMYSAHTTLPDQDSAEALGEALEDLEPFGVGVFEIEDGSGLYEIGVHFEEQPDEIILDLLAASFGAKPFVVSEVPDVDWVAKVKRELSPVEAGRFFVYGGHDADKVPEGRLPLLIEAAMAFGTGHHGTTLGCLRALDRLETQGFKSANTADIGAGTAVLAMAAAHLWPETVVAGDIDPVAVDVAAANAEANGMKGRVICVEAAGFDAAEIRARAPFELVFANILKGPLVALAPEMGGNVVSGGVIILSGILNEQADSVIEVYNTAGFTLKWRDEVTDWTTLTMVKN